MAGIVGGAYYLGKTSTPKIQPQQSITTTTPAPTANAPLPSPNSSPEKVVESFYINYWKCVEKHSENIRENCPLNQNNVLTDTLLQKLEEAKVYDPILCAQDLPVSITVDKATITNNTAQTIVHEEYTRDNQVTVDLNLINKQWKIVNITCHL